MSNNRDKYLENKLNKKNKKSDIKFKRTNKNSFIFDESIINQLPSGSFDKNNKIFPETVLPNKENIEYIDNKQSEKKNKDEEQKDDIYDEEYEEYTPDYFEPKVYIK
jgi:hypothetical protein